MITIDIETHPFVEGAPMLPQPTGFAIRWPDGTSEYLAFGHPSENNCSFDDARSVLLSIWHLPLLTHNGSQFDIPILQHWFELPPRDPLLTHDTLFLAYLANPHARSLALKDLARDLLGIPNTEQDELHGWIMQHTACRSRKKAGMHIWEAPGAIVGRYARADVEMTFRLYEHLQDVVGTMSGAYDRERKLAPILARLQHTGVRCDVRRLQQDYDRCRAEQHEMDIAVRTRLGTPDLNPDSNGELGDALERAGFNNFLTTPKGARSVNKESIDQALASDPELATLLRRRAALGTLLGTFMSNWLDIAGANGGSIHASYNQVRNPEGYGTRTGRLSSSHPNFQNIPNDLEPGLPIMKSYLLPDEGHVWTCGDFKAQEPRIAAHFEDGALCAAFNARPDLDPYVFVIELLQGSITRKESKAVFLGLLYAMGAPALARRLGAALQRATLLRNLIREAMPDVVALDRDCKRRFQLGLPIKTLGGRLCYCEPPVDGRTWEYKALNLLVQGSAADQTKEALVFADKELRLLDPSIRVLGTVHDEVSVSHPPHLKDKVYAILQAAANALPCDVPMLMDIHTGPSWAGASKK